MTSGRVRRICRTIVTATSLALAAGCSSQAATDDRAAGAQESLVAPAAPTAGEDWRWVGVRDVEVLAPTDWPFDHEAARPDCIDPDRA